MHWLKVNYTGTEAHLQVQCSTKKVVMQVLCVLIGLVVAPAVPSLAQERTEPVPPSGKKCPPVVGRNETCVCKTDQGIIDLTPLSNHDGTAKFTGMEDINDFSYSYNPCQPYTGEGGCNKIHICQAANDDPNLFYDIADPGTEAMYIDTDGTPYVYYTGPGNRDTRVYLKCDKSASFPVATTDGDTPVTLSYVFYITAREACPGGVGSNSVPVGEAGLAIIFGIIPLAVIVYIVVGVVVMKFHFKATGSDIIPNKNFWTTLPFLIKDGCVFTFSPIIGLIKGKVGKRNGYDSVG